MLADRQGVVAMCRELGVPEHTYYRWRNPFDGLEAEDAKRLKELEKQSATLKRQGVAQLVAHPGDKPPRYG